MALKGSFGGDYIIECSRRINPNIPIAVLSAYDLKGYKDKIKHNSADEYFEKGGSKELERIMKYIDNCFFFINQSSKA